METPVTLKAMRPRATLTFRWLLAISLVGIGGACGARVGKMNLPVGVTMVVFPVSPDSIKSVDETFPNTTLQLFAGGQSLSFSEDFELVLVGPGPNAKTLARYKSSDLAAAAIDTKCASHVAALANDKRALYCGASLQLANASMFLLVKPDGSTRVASSPSTDERDADAGVRHLTLSF